MYLDNERRPALTPQLAFRVAVIGGIALVMFGVIFFRLWYLQVLSGDDYVQAARDNRVRSIKVQAPRGEIVDRHGQELVTNRTSMSIKLTPDRLPDKLDERREVYQRLAKLLGLNPRRLERRVEGELRTLPFAKPTVKQDVNSDFVAYVLERQDQFPGVEPESKSLREYPHGSVGAHLFGQVGEVSPDDLKDRRNGELRMGDRIGKAGIEAQYDRFLRGRNGAAKVEVDALGNLTKALGRRQPVQGSQLRLSLDLDVQRVAQQALAGGTGKGAFAVMNVHNGEVLALGSQPSFDPNVFTKPLSKRKLDQLYSKDLGKPILNRAIQAGYPTGSTFKLVTAAAALESGHITPETVLNDPGSLTVGGVQLDAPTARRAKLSDENRQAILEGIFGAANSPGGTSTPVFEGFPVPVAGKTGTAEHTGKPDQSWYVALAPYPNPRYVVAVTDEAGGFGADTAAPMARLILAELLSVNEDQLVEGGGAPD